MSDYNTGIADSKEWKKAEKWFSQINQRSSFSIIGGGGGGFLSPGDLEIELDGLLAMYPGYFPALLLRGFNMLRYDSVENGERYLQDGLTRMLQIITDPDDFGHSVSSILENLEKLLRFDIGAKFLENAIRAFPEEAFLYDELAYFYLHLPGGGDKSKALQMQTRALELDPGNDYFLNNLGWIHLQMGYLKEAETCFRKAAEFDTSNSKAWENLETVENMQELNLNYFNYLVRPVDTDEFQQLDAADFEDASEICRRHNQDRIEAFRMYLMEKQTLKPHEIFDLLVNLETFTDTVEGVRKPEYGPFLYENPDMFLTPFKELLFDFIQESVHVESEDLLNIGKSLTALYEFLGEVNLITSSLSGQFKEQIDTSTGFFSGRIEEYYAIEHDIDLTAKERSEKIHQLFGITVAEQ